jgi:hypothetical protein
MIAVTRPTVTTFADDEFVLLDRAIGGPRGFPGRYVIGRHRNPVIRQTGTGRRARQLRLLSLAR